MNKIKKYYSELDIDRIENAIRDIHSCDKHGYFENDSEFKKICKDICDITGQSVSTVIHSVQTSILYEYALRNLGLSHN